MQVTAELYYPYVAGQTLRQVEHIDIDPELTGVSITREAPGGDADATLGLRQTPDERVYGWLPNLIDIPEYAHLVLRYRGLQVWTGRVLVRSLAGTRYHGCVAKGYGFHALQDVPFNLSSTAQIDVRQIVAMALRQCAPWLIVDSMSLNNIVDARSPEEWDGLTLAEVFDALSQQGTDETFSSLDHFVEGAGDRLLLRFRNRAPGTRGDYVVPYTESIFPSLDEDSTDVYSMLVAVHDDEHPFEIVVHRHEVHERLGFERILRQDVPSDIAHHAIDHWARTFLNQHVQPNISGECVLGLDDLVETRMGSVMPAHALQAGRYIQIGQGEGGNQPVKQAYIRKVNVDFNAKQVTCELGAIGRWSFTDSFSRTVVSVEKIRKRIDPLVGGRFGVTIGRVNKIISDQMHAAGVT